MLRAKMAFFAKTRAGSILQRFGRDLVSALLGISLTAQMDVQYCADVLGNMSHSVFQGKRSGGQTDKYLSLGCDRDPDCDGRMGLWCNHHRPSHRRLASCEGQKSYGCKLMTRIGTMVSYIVSASSASQSGDSWPHQRVVRRDRCWCCCHPGFWGPKRFY